MTRYSCARCGRKLAAEAMVYSRHTRTRYCADLAACDKRAPKRKRKGVAA